MPTSMETCLNEMPVHNHNNNAYRYFALCESCFWTATILRSTQSFDFECCPICSQGNTMSMIPLAVDEKYSVDFNSRGIELAFARSSK